MNAAPPLSSRHVFYIHGFDPRGPRHYHALYKNHALKQAAVSGMPFDISPRRKKNEIHSWRVDSGATRTEIEFLSWADVVRRHWSDDYRGVMKDLWFFLRAYAFGTYAGRFGRRSFYPLVAIFYPAVYILLGALLSGGLGYLVYRLLGASLWSALPGIAAAFMAMRSVMAFGKSKAVFWLLSIYAFTYKWAQDKVPEMAPRIDAFTARIKAVLQNNPAEEVLIVAHSVGTMVAIRTLAQVLRDLPDADLRLNLVTLGHCIPLVSFHDDARDFRRDLQSIAKDSRLTWLDYTTPTDGACFPFMDVVTDSGLERVAGAGPHILSPRFHKLYAKRRYKFMRYSWYKMHFLYMMSTDYAGDYDYFAITAGPQPLRTRIPTADAVPIITDR